MKINYLQPADKVSEFVHEILVFENPRATGPFLLPLFANGMPTLLFQTVKAQINNNSNYLTLFGQTVLPGRLALNDSFTLIAYFLKPHCLVPLFGISPQELTDKPIDLNLISHRTVANLQDRVLKPL
jgi:hypothetical protein